MAIVRKRKVQVRVEVYPDAGGGWRWRLHVGNALVAGSSGEAFASKGNAKRAARRLGRLFNPASCDVEVVVADG